MRWILQADLQKFALPYGICYNSPKIMALRPCDIKEMVIVNTIEDSIFARKRWIKDKMLAFGFEKEGQDYCYESDFLNGDFTARLSVSPKGQVTGIVIDKLNDEEYYPLRQKDAAGAYVSAVRDAYETLLKDMAASCCKDVLFASEQANRLMERILKTFMVRPDFPWEKTEAYQSYGAFRHTNSGKWFALIMNVKKKVLNKDDNDALVDIVNVKIDPQQGDEIRRHPGIYEAYHMSHKTWISIVLDESLSDDAIMGFIENSFRLTE